MALPGYILQDPDADFLLQLPQGVPLGVNQTLTPSPAWPEYTGTLPEEVPLQDCLDSWKSAQGHPEIVQSLIQEELDAGFIAHVPGGVPQLKQMYAKTAIGKPGVVIAPGRSPRLVVDSSISMVTANTVLSNHVLLPRISDVMQCAPIGMSAQQMTQNLPWMRRKPIAGFLSPPKMEVCCVSTPTGSSTGASH